MVARAFTIAGTHSSIPTVRKMTAGTSGTETGLHVGSYGSVSNKMIGVYELVRISHDSATSKTTIRYKQDANRPPFQVNRYTFSDLVITNIGGTSYNQTFNFQDDTTLDSVTRSSGEMVFVFNVNTAFVNTNEYRVEFVPRKGKGDCFIEVGTSSDPFPQIFSNPSLQYTTMKGYCIEYDPASTSSRSKFGNITSGGTNNLNPRITVTGERYPRNLLRTQLPVEAVNYGYLIKALLWFGDHHLDRLVLCLDTNGDYDDNTGLTAVSGFNKITIHRSFGDLVLLNSARSTVDQLSPTNNYPYFSVYKSNDLPGDHIIEWRVITDPFTNAGVTDSKVRITFD